MYIREVTDNIVVIVHYSKNQQYANNHILICTVKTTTYYRVEEETLHSKLSRYLLNNSLKLK